MKWDRQAMALIRWPARLEVILGATHLFEEPGTRSQAAALVAGWFVLLPAALEHPAADTNVRKKNHK